MEILEKFKSHLFFYGYSKNTISSYYFDLKIVFEKLKLKSSEDILKIDIKNIHEMIFDIKNTSLNRSINRKIAALKTFFQFFNLENKTNLTIHQKISYLKVPSLLPKAFDIEVIKKIDNYLNSRNVIDWKKYRDKLIFNLLFTTGCRISECMNIKISDIKNETELIKIISKGGNEGNLIINQKILKNIFLLIKHYPFKVENNDFLFLSNRDKKLSIRYVQKLFEEIRYVLNLNENLTPHAIRHTIATTLLENDMDIMSISKFLRHKNLNTTEKYTKINKKKILESMKKINKLY
jgi:site-specific recombinase XerD